MVDQSTNLKSPFIRVVGQNTNLKSPFICVVGENTNLQSSSTRVVDQSTNLKSPFIRVVDQNTNLQSPSTRFSEKYKLTKPCFLLCGRKIQTCRRLLEFNVQGSKFKVFPDWLPALRIPKLAGATRPKPAQQPGEEFRLSKTTVRGPVLREWAGLPWAK